MADIIELLERRDERALELLREHYESYCRSIVANLLQDEQQAEEALSDVWIQVWNSIPPARPRHLRAYLAKTARNIAINYIRHDSAAKRSGSTVVLDELAECIPDQRWEDRVQAGEVREMLNSFLRSLPAQERQVFLRRYWFGETVSRIARDFGCSESRITSLLHRLRKRLKKHLEQEGYRV